MTSPSPRPVSHGVAEPKIMREIVGVLTTTGIVTNDPAAVIEAIRWNRVSRLLSRWEMQFMSAADLGVRWDNMARGPTLFLYDGEDVYPADYKKET